MLIDANLLLYAVDERSPQNGRARDWLSDTLNGDRRVALPWQSLGAFLRISTHPRVSERPLTGPVAWSFVEDWLAAPTTWIPPAGARTASILGGLISDLNLTANLIPDAQLAALAIEHGLILCSADSDFARFPDLRWENPITAP